MSGENKEVLLVGRAEFESIFKTLQKMQEEAQNAGNAVGDAAKKTQESLDNQAKKTESGLKRTGAAMRRLANQLYSDFKGLASIEALKGGLQLSSQFKGVISESITLGDTIRRLGGSFGIAKDQFGKFQGSLSRGLGDIGASSEAAAQALEGLAGLGVKGGESAMGLAKGAVTLAGMSGERGGEKKIANLLGRTIQAQGKNVNDSGAQQAIIGEVTAAVQATGKQSSEILGAMEQIFGSMDRSMRGKVGPQSMAQMAVMASTVGPAATKALEEYFSKGAIQRMPLEAQGFNIFGDDGGIDMSALKGFVEQTRGRIGGDPRSSLMTAGFSEEAAEGLVRLADQSETVANNLAKLDGATRDNERAYRESMSMIDAFKGSINTVKGRIEEFTGGLTQTVSDFLAAQVGDTAGSTAVVAGGATLAALLAGGGLRGVGKGLSGAAGGMAAKAGYEGVTGEKVQPVYVVNAAEIGGSGGMASAAGGMLGGKLGGALKLGGGALAAGAAGYAAGEHLINPALDKYTTGKTSEGFEGNAIEQLIFKLDKLIGGQGSKNIMQANQAMKVVIETKEPNLRAKTKVSRGASN